MLVIQAVSEFSRSIHYIRLRNSFLEGLAGSHPVSPTSRLTFRIESQETGCFFSGLMRNFSLIDCLE